MINDILQGAAVAIILALAVIWIVRRVRRKGSSPCDCGCGGCPIKGDCRKPTKEK